MSALHDAMVALIEGRSLTDAEAEAAIETPISPAWAPVPVAPIVLPGAKPAEIVADLYRLKW